MKKVNIFKRILWAITDPFVGIAVFIDEERRQNLDGRYDDYWRKKNEREMEKEKRRNAWTKKTRSSSKSAEQKS